MYPTLQIAGIALPLRPLLFLVGAWLCLTISERRMPRFGLEPDLAWNLGMLTGGVTLVGARLWYALSHWSAYQSNLTGLVATSTSTLALNEGVALGLLMGLIYVQRQRAPWSRLADAFTPGLLAAFGLASLGALLSGDAYGAPTGLPWSIELWGAQRHPSQVYELLLALIVLGIGLRWLQRLPEGLSFLSASALYASGRVFVEAFRGDSIIVGEGIRAMQVAWLAIALVSVLALSCRQSANAQREPTPKSVGNLVLRLPRRR